MTTVAQALDRLLGDAAATITAPVLPIVRAGEPDIAGDVPTLAYWFMARRTWEANTFSKTQKLSCWHIRAYCPMTPRITVSADGNVEAWLEAAVVAVEYQLFGHELMYGAATGEGFELSDATAGWVTDTNGSKYRVVDWDLDVMLSAVHDIAAGASHL